MLAGLLSPADERSQHCIGRWRHQWQQQRVRLRTSTGHPNSLNDSEGIIYIANATGSAYIEMGRSGNLDIYAADSIISQ